MTTHNTRGTLIGVMAALLFLQVSVGLTQEVQRGEITDNTADEVQGLTAPNNVTGIDLSPLTPNILKFGQNVTVSFTYDTDDAGGVRIFVRPMTGDLLTPNYAACGSPLYPVGSGVGSCTFTITDVNAIVDTIRIQMWNANQTTKLFQAKLPVHYRFR
jgi:hypothetical protein